MRDIIINLKKSDTKKIQLTIAINFIFFKDIGEERVLHSNSDNIEFMSYYNANEVVNELLMNSQDWLKKKKTTIYPKTEGDKCFIYAVTVALNYGEIESHPEKISNIKPFILKYNCKGINYRSKIERWKTFEKNNPTIAVNILYIKEKESYPAYISKYDSTREKQIILLMIPNEEKGGWYYLAVEKVSTLLHVITSKHKGNFYFLNCLRSFKTENKLKFH